MFRRTLLAALLLVLAACGPAPSEPSLARPAATATRDGDPPPPDSTTQPPADTTNRGGGGTIGSGT